MNATNGNYGIDGPPVIRNLVVLGIAAIIGAFISKYLFGSSGLLFETIIWYCCVIAGSTMLLSVVLLLWSSTVGKLHVRETLIDSLALQGHEIVVDIGCGRGLLLTAAARRLKTGKAIGIDLWQTADQSGNDPETTLKNARMEGVSDRVEVKTGDMRSLPFPDNSVDVIVSSLAIHNIPEKNERAKAIQEIARILKPNGHAALLDFRCTGEYLATLHNLGWNEAVVSNMVFQMFPPARVVKGKKP
jgi:ubiquinone/menaquinone biosynthesis C-methylase UbiE